MTEPVGVIGVVRRRDELSLPRTEPPLGPARVVPVDELAAVVAAVPADLVERLGRDDVELDDVAPLARAHDDALIELAASVPVVPLRVGTIVADDEDVVALLRSNAEVLGPTLDRLEGRAEWVVEVAPPPPPAPSAEAGGGAAYLREARDRRRAEEQRRLDHDDAVAAVVDLLDGAGVPARDLGTRREDGTRRVACLLADDGVTDLRARLEAAVAADGAPLVLRGPYPAYHFAGTAT